MVAQKSATLGALSWGWEGGKRLGVRARQIAGVGQGAACEGQLVGAAVAEAIAIAVHLANRTTKM